MVGKVLNITDFMAPDQLGNHVAKFWVTNNALRQDWLNEKIELRKYVFATSTKKTNNATQIWKNTTTIPKACQIRDNLTANYYLNSFPRRMWFDWEADNDDSNEQEKREAIKTISRYWTNYGQFKSEMKKCIDDWVDYGNCFGTVEWIDNRVRLPNGKEQVGYVGPCLRRISPLDIVFNPTAPSFRETPKVVRSIVSFGELKKILNSQSNDENRKEYEDLFNYLKEIRRTAQAYTGDMQGFDEQYAMDGFTSFRNYLISDMVEILTFYGDVYDWENDEFLENYVITVVDRHKVIGKKPNPSYFGYAPIFHCGWRPRQDNLWAMGPLDNLIGMQFRIDYVENQKADYLTIAMAPPLKIKGTVQDFTWGPMARIYCGDDGDVEVLMPNLNILQLNTELAFLFQTMEMIAGAPGEQMGIRSPGEKTAFEVQKLDNAGSRIYGAKIQMFEEQFTENILNGLLELGRRNISGVQSIPVFDDDFNFQSFMDLTSQDITGAGRLKPIAARNFAEKAELLQNLNTFFNSPMGQDPTISVHFSGVQLAKFLAQEFQIKDYSIVQPYVRLAEQADAQRLAQSYQQQVGMEAMTPSGLTPDDHDPSVDEVPMPPPMEEPK